MDSTTTFLQPQRMGRGGKPVSEPTAAMLRGEDNKTWTRVTKKIRGKWGRERYYGVTLND